MIAAPPLHVRRFGLAFAVFAQLHAASSAPPNAGNATVDGPALVREWTPAKYPAEALGEKMRGRATVRIIVDEQGHVTKARVVSAGDPRFGEAALAAVQTW
jgi:outer membrane biosynthesis protein TonB